MERSKGPRAPVAWTQNHGKVVGVWVRRLPWVLMQPVPRGFLARQCPGVSTPRGLTL